MNIKAIRAEAVLQDLIAALEAKEIYRQDFDPEVVKQFLELTNPNREQVAKCQCKCCIRLRQE